MRCWSLLFALVALFASEDGTGCEPDCWDTRCA